jgi:hypothetical protein
MIVQQNIQSHSLCVILPYTLYFHIAMPPKKAPIAQPPPRQIHSPATETEYPFFDPTLGGFMDDGPQIIGVRAARPHGAMNDIDSIVFLSGPPDMVRRIILLLMQLLMKLCLTISQTL